MDRKLYDKERHEKKKAKLIAAGKWEEFCKEAAAKKRQQRAARTDAEKKKDKLAAKTYCKTCNDGKSTRMIANCPSIKTACYGCIKEYLLYLAKNPTKSYLTVKVLKEDVLLKVSNPLFVEGSSDEWEDQPFYFVDIKGSKAPYNFPIVCIMAQQGAFDKK